MAASPASSKHSTSSSATTRSSTRSDRTIQRYNESNELEKAYPGTPPPPYHPGPRVSTTSAGVHDRGTRYMAMQPANPPTSLPIAAHETLRTVRIVSARLVATLRSHAVTPEEVHDDDDVPF
ncbi:hypothetical protein LTR53_010077 [Teratosphaeriaceae sp. CCFEE 6253]|nr:hypothetical protein LTR53_010077 [Teratosphaeriaceae sp. CCFEE 6253]